ncbi:MAG: hypothetical protein ACOCXG_02490 [Nanoarchaeota archaeon]
MADANLLQKEKKYTYKGYFDPQQTYLFCKDYLKKTKNYTINERDYDEVNNSAEQRIFAVVEAEQDYTDYFRNKVTYVITLSGKKTEVVVNGKKTKLVKGVASLKAWGNIDLDYSERRSKENLFRKYIDNLYHKFFNKAELEKCADELQNDILELIERFKQALNSGSVDMREK